MSQLFRTIACLALLGTAALAAAQTPPAEQIFVGGSIYTQDDTQPWAEAVAIANGRYLAVGSNSAVRAYAGPHTRVTDLKGRMLMPGLIDAHVHAANGAMAELYDCVFPATVTPQQLRPILLACVKQAPPGAWLIGGNWGRNFFNDYRLESPRRWLDAIVGDHPVILSDDATHNAWVNSAALRLAGVDAGSADPVGGRFEREADGKTPNGVALETAADLLNKAVSPRTAGQLRAGIMRVQKLAQRFGIVGIKEADAFTPTIAAYHDADIAHQLNLYVATCITTVPMQQQPESQLDFTALDAVRDHYRSDLVDTRFVKIFLDGIPTPSRTAAMLAPYLPDAKGAVTSGLLHVAPETLRDDLIELDRRGYTVKMHAAGDRAIRVGLDAVAAVRQGNHAGVLHHELAHAGYIAADDLPRFAALQVLADLSPVIWYPSPIIDSILAAVGERGQQYWPVRTLVASNALLAAGSDWPSVSPSMDPWGGIEALITRSDPYRASTRRLWPEEAVDLKTALRIYTLGGAVALRREAETGSIIAGKSADFIVLDRNLFKVPVTQIGATRVLMTYFRGHKVFDRAIPD